MIEKIRSAIQTALAFGLILFLGAIGLFLAWKIGWAFWSTFGNADPNVKAAIVAAAITALIAFGGHLFERRKHQVQLHKEKKAEMYKGLMTHFMSIVKASDGPESFDKKANREFFINFYEDLVLWASPKVIKAYIEFTTDADKTEQKELFKKIDNLYKAMRADLGLSNRGLSEGELILAMITSEDRQEFLE